MLLWDCSAVWFQGKVAGSAQPHVDYHSSTCLCAGWLSHRLNKSGWRRLRCVWNLNQPLSWQVEDSPREATQKRSHVTPPRSPDARGNQDCLAISALVPLKWLQKWLLWGSNDVFRCKRETDPKDICGESLAGRMQTVNFYSPPCRSCPVLVSHQARGPTSARTAAKLSTRRWCCRLTWCGTPARSLTSAFSARPPSPRRGTCTLTFSGFILR